MSLFLTFPALLSVCCATSRFAFTTLLYSDDVAVGASVLGASLDLTGHRDIDRIVMVTDGVSAPVRADLQRQGWIVRPVALLSNPLPGHHVRFSGVFTKLQAWALTEYERVVFLDGDMLVIDDLHDLFGCPGFCAVWLSAYWFNAGLMVIEPSDRVYKDLLNKLSDQAAQLDPDLNEQQFLNWYYQEAFASALTFESGHRPPVKTEGLLAYRLSPQFQGDAGLFLKDGRFKTRVRVIHYLTFLLKPWFWLTFPLFKLNERWHAVRMSAPYLPFPHTTLSVSLPTCLVLVLFFLHRRRPRITLSLKALWQRVPCHRCLPFWISLLVHACCLPRDFHPVLAWSLVCFTTGGLYLLLESVASALTVSSVLSLFLFLVHQPSGLLSGKLPLLASGLCLYCMWLGWELREFFLATNRKRGLKAAIVFY
eukprot:g67570.t1